MRLVADRWGIIQNWWGGRYPDLEKQGGVTGEWLALGLTGAERGLRWEGAVVTMVAQAGRARLSGFCRSLVRCRSEQGRVLQMDG